MPSIKQENFFEITKRTKSKSLHNPNQNSNLIDEEKKFLKSPTKLRRESFYKQKKPILETSIKKTKDILLLPPSPTTRYVLNLVLYILI